MRRIITFFYNIKPVWQFSLFLMLSIILLFSNSESRIAPLRSISLVIMDAFAGFTDYVKTNQKIKFENEKLKEKLVKQTFLKNLYQNLYYENLRYKKLLHLKNIQNFHFIYAKIIGVSPYRGLQGFIIDKGEKDSIRVNDVVLSLKGLVGRVMQVSANNAIVQILLDRNIQISAKILRNNERGMLRYFNKNLMIMDYVPKNIQVIQGDIVVTAETSQVYPPGIKIGKVVSIDKKPEDHFQKIYIQPFVHFNNLTEVIIVKANYEQ